MSITREITLNDVDPRTGELVWRSGEANEVFLEHLTNSHAWDELAERFDLSEDSNLQVVTDFLVSIAPPLILSKAESGLRKLLYAGGVCKFGTLTAKPAEMPVPEVSTTPIHKGQEMWKEHAEWLCIGGKNGGPPSMEEVRARKRTSPSFRAYVEQAYAAETNPLNDPIVRADAEALWKANPHLAPQAQVKPHKLTVAEKKDAATMELRAWAEEYRRTPMERVKQLRSPSINPLGYQQYEENLQAAIQAGLII
jgi:hypothetical protein